MQYDDDIEESQVTMTRQEDPKQETPAKPKESKEKGKGQAKNLDEVMNELGGEEEEDDDDLLMDDPAAFVERQSSNLIEDAKQAYIFEDDPRASRKRVKEEQKDG